MPEGTEYAPSSSVGSFRGDRLEGIPAFEFEEVWFFFLRYYGWP